MAPCEDPGRPRRGAAAFAVAAFAVLAGAPAPVRAQVVDCYGLWREEPSDWGVWTEADGTETTETPCELYLPASDSLSRQFATHIRIFLPEGWQRAPHPAAPPNVPELIVQATRRTLATLQPLYAPFPIDIVLVQNISRQKPILPTDTEAEQEANAWDWDTAADTGGDSPCPVTLYITSVIDIAADDSKRPYSDDDIRNTVAHELFHCYQYRYFREKMLSPAQEDGADEWWIEGSAEFFSNRLYPCGETAAGFTRQYRPTTRLNRQPDPYSVYIFFMYLADRHGFELPELATFIASMTTASGVRAQNEALAAQPDIGLKFHEFAKAYVDRTISHCVGENVGFASVATTPATDGIEIVLDRAPFTFQPPIVVLKKQTDYKVTLVGGDGAAGRHAISWRALDGDWTRMDGEFYLSGGCDADTSYVFLSTVEGPGEEISPARLVFTEETGGISRASTCGDCPVGIWNRDIAQLNAYVAERASRVSTKLDNPITGEIYSGQMTLILTNDGRAVQSYQDFVKGQPNVKVFLEGAPKVTSRYSGSSSGSWLADAGSPTTAEDDRLRFDWKLKGVTDVETWPSWTIGGATVPERSETKRNRTGPLGPNSNTPISYSCEGDGALMLGEGRYTRVP